MIRIGLETHVQLNCKTKIFCSCENKTSEKPNIYTCETCLGMPGSKPALNKEALNQAVKVALVLGCKINNKTFFSRKTYFYPDLPKNFQITQYEIPVAEKGRLDEIRIRRIHLEEDPGKLIHKDDYVLIDYNRSGIPLIEIVTEPDFKSPEEARAFLNKLVLILKYLKIYSKADDLVIKTDANISLNNGPKVEIKNINSVKDVERALEYEVERQKEGKVIQETRGWDDAKGVTVRQRVKETEDDYGYIFDADLPYLELDDKYINGVKKYLPELAEEKISRFIKKYKISPDDAKIIASIPYLAELFEKACKDVKPEIAAKWLRRDLRRNLDEAGFETTEVNEKELIILLRHIQNKEITDHTARDLLERLVKENIKVEDYIKKHGLVIVSDESSLTSLCKKVIKENTKATEDYKSGKEDALHFLFGKVMRETKGQASPDVVRKLLKELLK